MLKFSTDPIGRFTRRCAPAGSPFKLLLPLKSCPVPLTNSLSGAASNVRDVPGRPAVGDVKVAGVLKFQYAKYCDSCAKTGAETSKKISARRKSGPKRKNLSIESQILSQAMSKTGHAVLPGQHAALQNWLYNRIRTWQLSAISYSRAIFWYGRQTAAMPARYA